MKRSIGLALFGIALAFCAMTPAAQAQATRTWVSGLGDDANPCSRTSPCKTFAGAYSRTAVGGEIDAIDPGGFGTISIGHALTIDGGGGQVASILASSTVGVNVTAGAAEVVTLRNLRITGVGQYAYPGTKGVNIVSAGTVRVDHCVIEGFSQYGIDAENANRTFLDVVDSQIQNNVIAGVFTSTPAGTGGRNRVSIVNSALMGNGVAVHSTSNSRVQITGSMLAASITGGGILADASTSNVSVADSSVTNNSGPGIHASNSAIVRISNVMVSQNPNGLVFDSGGQIISWGNNHVADNPAGDGAPSSTIGPI